MRYHLCCNSLEYCWEIRDKQENISFKGRLAEVKEYTKIHNLDLR